MFGNQKRFIISDVIIMDNELVVHIKTHIETNSLKYAILYTMNVMLDNTACEHSCIERHLTYISDRISNEYIITPYELMGVFHDYNDRDDELIDILLNLKENEVNNIATTPHMQELIDEYCCPQGLPIGTWK